MVDGLTVRFSLCVGLVATLFTLLSACSDLSLQVPDPDGTQKQQDEQAAPYGHLLFSANGMPENGERRYGYASSVDLNGQRLIVGSLGGQDVSRGDGAFIYSREGDTWELEAQLDIVPTVRPESTASSVALSGDYAALNYQCGVESGKPCWQEPSGYFIFQSNGVDWLEAAHFRGETIHGTEGAPLEFAGDYLFAGRDDGSIDIHRLGNGDWERTQTLTGVDFFEVVAEGEHLLGLSAQGVEHYMLTDGRWVHQEGNRDFRTRWGWLDLEGPRLVLSHAEADKTTSYLLQQGEWQLESEIGHSGPVALAGPFLLVGAPDDDELATNAGAVHVYELENGNWERVNTLYAPDPGEDRKFGNRLAASEELAVVGAFSSDYDRRDFSGAIYIFGHGSAE